VIEHNLCPFAHPFAKKDLIAYRVSAKQALEDRLYEFLDMLDELDESSSYRTTLLIYDDPNLDFTSYLDLYDLCVDLLEEEGREYQLASFHPAYCFAGEEEADPANLSNRSPHPMIHILRLDDVHLAITNHGDPESIPIRNIDYLRRVFSEKGT
jgi:hypothetical protein